MVITAESHMDQGLEVISIFKQTKTLMAFPSLMAKYYWLFPEADCLRWLQTQFFIVISCHRVYSLCVSLWVLADCLPAFFTAVWMSGIGSRKPRFLKVSVIGGHTHTQRAAWVFPGSPIVFGARISCVNN